MLKKKKFPVFVYDKNREFLWKRPPFPVLATKLLAKELKR
jgi:hypothetical protein